MFLDPANGKPISVPWFWMGGCTVADIRPARLHDIRNDFASQAAAMSETLSMIGKLLGHVRLDSTARYAHLDDADLMGACDRIGDLITRMAG